MSRSSNRWPGSSGRRSFISVRRRSEEHTSELQSLRHLVCRLLLEKKKDTTVEELNGLTALQWLNLALAPVTSVEALMGLTALEVISLSQTQVTRVVPLKGVTGLQ